MKKFCFVIAVFLMFVSSCDNLYNEVAEEKKDMQKLVFVNANGVSVDLTSGNYGITEWSGFANTELNLQTQQVPFHDGSVYLDGLLSERELSVTLAMNDENNLEKRYQLRRELISILNPKLGEGTLIYTNDYTSKQIRCVPQIPIFENHNSNDSGTPKASLAWTACDPYWEDVEETVVEFETNTIPVIMNNGDVQTSCQIEFFSNNMENPSITNLNTDKSIRYIGTLTDSLAINTQYGKKEVYTENYKTIIKENNGNIYDICYAVELGISIAVCGKYYLLSYDGNEWNPITFDFDDDIICCLYSEIGKKFLIGGSNGALYESQNGQSWDKITTGLNVTLNKIYETSSMNIIVGDNGTILTSDDTLTWTSQTSGTNYNVKDVAYSAHDSQYVAVASIEGSDNMDSVILKSSNLTTWTTQTSPLTLLYGITYSEEKNLYVICGYTIGTAGASLAVSSNSSTWNIRTIQYGGYIVKVKYFSRFELFVAIADDGQIVKSSDGTNWSNLIGLKRGFAGVRKGNVFYNNQQEAIYSGGASGIIQKTMDGDDWTYIRGSDVYKEESQFSSIVYNKKTKRYIAYGMNGYSDYGIFISADCKNWTLAYTTTISINRIRYIEETNVVLALSGQYVLVSFDDENWSAYNTGSYVILYDVCYNSDIEKYYAVGDLNGSGAGGIIYTSTNLTSWISSGQFPYILRAITFAEQRKTIIMTGDNGFIGKATDSDHYRTWDYITAYFQLRDVIYVDMYKRFVAVSLTDILYSQDGTTWERCMLDTANVSRLAFDSVRNVLFAVGSYGNILISNNGINWTQLKSYVNNFVNGCTLNTDTEEMIVGGYFFTILSVIMEKKDNVIQNLSDDSDMNFYLQKGLNRILVTKKSGSLTCRIIYRQKYIGV